MNSMIIYESDPKYLQWKFSITLSKHIFKNYGNSNTIIWIVYNFKFSKTWSNMREKIGEDLNL
jgi:hypothetical protein